MSSETVKKRGRPKKAVSLVEEVIVIEQPAKTRPRKPTTRKPTVPKADEPVTAKTTSTKSRQTQPIVQSQVVGRTSDDEKAAVEKFTTNDAAKQNIPLAAGSDILERAKAFRTIAQSPTFPDGDAARLETVNQTTAGSTTTIVRGELNATPVNDRRTTIPEHNSLNTINEQQPQRGATEDSSRAGLQQVKNLLPSNSAAITVTNAPVAPVPQASDPSLVAPMSTSNASGPPSNEATPASSPVRNTTAASSPPQSKSSSSSRPLVSSKLGPRLPSSFAPPPAPPPRPRPTQLPYHELKKDPEFKALSRKYTSLIIAIPIALFTSYVLWGRYTNQAARKRIGDGSTTERSGGAKPRLLVETAPQTAMPVNDATNTGIAQSSKRLLEE